MMFRSIILAIIIGTTSLTGFSQTPLAENWQRFQPDYDDFSIDTPLKLKNDGENDEKSSRKYYGQIKETYLYVFSDPVKSAFYSDVVKRFVESSGKSFLPEKDASNPTLLSFDDSFGYHHNLVMLKTKKRLYIAQAISKSQNDPVVRRFISSFALTTDREKPNDKINPGPVPAEKPTPEESVDLSNGKGVGVGQGNNKGGGQGSGQGSGRGSGTGPGSGGGIGTGQPPKPLPGETRGLRVLSKPRPAYTNFARVYEISGTVILRVTFLASGVIGSVTMVKGLPFGLTIQAIEAVKRLRFEPAVTDGVPVSVVKQVEYSFLIY